MEVSLNPQYRLWKVVLIVMWIMSILSLGARAYSMKPGRWRVLIENGGVSAMHMTVTHLNMVVMFDRTNFGPSQLKLDKGRCRENQQDLALTHDCWAHSIEYNVASNGIRPLMVFTDTWCSSGSFTANGTLVHVGGWREGGKAICYFVPCSNGVCDWDESKAPKLADY